MQLVKTKKRSLTGENSESCAGMKTAVEKTGRKLKITTKKKKKKKKERKERKATMAGKIKRESNLK